MRLALVFILPVIVLCALCDLYIYRQVTQRAQRNKPFWKWFTIITSVILLGGIVAVTAIPKRGGSNGDLLTLMWCLYGFFSIYLPKLLWVVADLISRIPQLWHERRLPGYKWVEWTLAAVVFVAMWFGVANTHRIDVEEITYRHPDLPASFDGLRVAQISDLHVGTYGSDTSFVAQLVDRVNSLRPDVILFTGDIVNRRSDELLPFAHVLARLKAPCGIFSILGNHDYGDYYNWPSPAAKTENMQLLKDLQAGMGWKMLNNESATLRRGADSLVIIGVENIGDPPFPVYGDLDAAYPADPADPAFKILMSHNPAHWTDDIKDAPDKNIALTLSGHTHAMQMSIGHKVSPAALRYRTWGGMYSDEGRAHDLYVNIGTGEVAIPARIGATPEITLFTLRHAAKED